MVETMATLTIFTPTYNREATLPRTYRSLREQENKDFLWLIVDDGSTDETRKLVEKWKKKEREFEIQYIYQENGGMHTAHNTAYAHIKTELSMCIDSDDRLAKGAVEKILKKWGEVKEKGYAGIIGLDADFYGQVIGKGFPKNQKETTLSAYYASGGRGDKKLIYRTKVIKQYPEYPVFEGEKYVALAYKYRLIDQNYKLAVLPQILCEVEYQKDGSTKTMWKQYANAPKGFAFWRNVCMKYPQSKKRLFIDAIFYVSHSIMAGERDYIKKSERKWITILVIPFGYCLARYTSYRIKRQKA